MGLGDRGSFFNQREKEGRELKDECKKVGMEFLKCALLRGV